MSSDKPTSKLDNIVAEARKNRDIREKNYREKALSMYPWACGRCAREFTHKNLRELTVHHRDHNHDNNPEDGSNWELLCLYCHDNEHSRLLDNEHSNQDKTSNTTASHNPFSGLASMLKYKAKE